MAHDLFVEIVGGLTVGITYWTLCYIHKKFLKSKRNNP